MSLQKDFIAAVRSRDIWLYFACQDIRLRYRRSKVGPFWITLSMVIFCLSLAVVYGQLFKADTAEYLPFLSIGFVFWGLMSGILGEFPNVFIDNAAYIKDSKTNPFAILFRMMARHIIIFLHNSLIFIGIYLYFGINPGWSSLLVIPALFLVLLNLLAMGVSLSLFGLRFRDVPPIIQSMIQVLFFITPITWFPKLLASDSWVMRANPFAYYLDLLRSPMLGHEPHIMSWLIACCTLLVFSVIAARIYKAKASRIPFWV